MQREASKSLMNKIKKMKVNVSKVSGDGMSEARTLRGWHAFGKGWRTLMEERPSFTS